MIKLMIEFVIVKCLKFYYNTGTAYYDIKLLIIRWLYGKPVSFKPCKGCGRFNCTCEAMAKWELRQ